MSAVILTPAESRIVLLRSAAGYRIVRPSGYVLPVAGASTLGGVKVGSGLSVAGDGTLSATGGVWGSITGTLSSQSDLNAALAARALTSGTLAQFAATTSAELAGVLTDETGSGSAVFSVSPTLTTPIVSGDLTVTGQIVGVSGFTGGLELRGSGTSTNRVEVNGFAMFGLSGSTIQSAMNRGASSSFSVLSTGGLVWGTTTSAEGPSANATAGIFRPSASTLEITNGRPTSGGGALGGLSVSTLTATGMVHGGSTGFGVGTTTTNFRGQFSGVGVGLTVNAVVSWAPGDTYASAGDVFNVADVRIRRSSIGVLAIDGVGTGGTGDLRLRNLSASGLTTLGTYTVATLPSASANAGAFAQVTDSNSTTNGNIVAGGGANRVPVFSNGTNWIIK